MIIFNDISTFKLEDKDVNRIHIPRIYINDFNQVSLAMKILCEKGYLDNSEMTEETARIRSEHIREILILLWRLGCGVEVVRYKKTYSFKGPEEFPQGFKKKESFLEFIKSKLDFYNPANSVLDIIHKKSSWNEKVIEKIFHYSDSPGNADNIHPLIRWLKGLNYISKNLKVTEAGKKKLKNLKKINPYYIHEILDLKNEKIEHVLCEIFHQLSLLNINKFPVSLKKRDFQNLIFLSAQTKKFLKINNKKLDDKIKDFIRRKLPLRIKDDKLIILNPIFFDIKPKNYINWQLNKYFREKKEELNNKTKKSIEKAIDAIIIKDENQEINRGFYPKNSHIFTYDDFTKYKNEILNASPKFLILPNNWRPIKNIKISGYLDFFVRFGGNLIIVGGEPGRIGANMNQFAWLPTELSKINYLGKKEKSYFKFTFGKKLKKTKIINSLSLSEKQDRFTNVVFSYFEGTISFINSEYNNDFSFQEKFFSNKISINSSSDHWINCEILHQFALIKPERKMYPVIKKFLAKNFKFEFDPKIIGSSGQTDIFSTKPFLCLFEVDTVGVNQIICSSQKVSEVDRHYRKMKRQKRFDDSAKCVIAYEFATESGEDREGAVETAKDFKVNLIRYRDLYDMSCMNLNRQQIKSLIYDYEDDIPEISNKINKLHHEKN